MKPAQLISLLILNFLWASVYSAYKLLGPVPSGSIVTLRFGLAGILLAVLWPWLPGRAPRGLDLVKTCALGVVLYVVGQRLQVYGNEIGSAGNSAVLMSVEPLLTSVAAALLLKEQIGPRRIAGFALALIGVAVLNGVWRPDFKWTGLGASLIFISSFICEAAYSVVGKTIVEKASPVKMLVISLCVGLAINLCIDGSSTMAAARSLNATGWVLMLIMAILCTAIGYTLWFVIIRECPVNVVALTVFSQSIFGVLVAAVWLKEQLHWGQFWGSATIVAGLVLGLSRQVHAAHLSEAEMDGGVPKASELRGERREVS
jgi:drug/metabolite transporter (DMT)-like permease